MKLRYLYLTLIFVLLFSIPTLAKDEWISVRSKNFFLIGDAKEKNIRKVATKLEQFREVFGKLFPNVKFNSGIQTNVVVFKNSKSYKPFKPKNAKGEADKWIAGYFQPGEDVNYITLSTDGDINDTYGTIFHEYVHYLLDTNFGKTEVPPWFNEGLAEYYQTFSIKDDRKVTLGGLQNNHLRLLQRYNLIPLRDFFKVDNYSLHQNANHSRSVFYAQAWALIHYLIQGNGGANNAALNNFLSLVLRDVDPEEAFKKVFKMDYEEMEKILKRYAKKRVFKTTLITFKEPLIFDTEMSVTTLSEADANAYLGDLLYHTNEPADAEVYLKKSLALDENHSLANTALGLVKMRQGKFDEAKNYLEKAVASDQNNHLVLYNYAYVLSREGTRDFGYVSSFPKEKVEKMRMALRKAIEIKPRFTRSYSLLAFINLVSDENLDESVKLLNQSLSLKPGDTNSLLQLAQIYLRQEKYKEAKKVAEKLIKNATDPSIRASSQNLLKSIQNIEQQVARNNSSQSRPPRANRNNSPAPKVVREEDLSEEEIKKIKQEKEVFNINRILEKPKKDEAWVLGYIQKIDCVSGKVIYDIKSEFTTLTLTSKDFQSLALMAHTDSATQKVIGCDVDLKDVHSVITYRKENNTKTDGTITRIDFVPEFFEFKSDKEIASEKPVVIISKEMEDRQKKLMIQSIKDSLRKIQAGEKRAVGIAESIECKRNNVVFRIKIGEQIFKLKTKNPQNVMIRGFTRDMGQIQLRCGFKFPSVTTVFTYRPDNKKEDEGEAIALEFVPKGFEL